MMKRRLITLVLASAVYCVLPVVVPALQAQTPVMAAHTQLVAIDSLLARGRFRDATAALDKWERDNANRITPADRATALLLRGRMTVDADSARAIYLQLSLGYPSSPEAPVAFVRLGQLAQAASDMARAKSYFQRVVSDYPDSPVHADAVALLAAANAPGSKAPPQRSAPATPPPSVVPPRTDTRTQTTADTRSTSNGAFAVQIGAFRDRTSAAAAANKLTQLGFAARVASIKGSALVRVRVGRFETSRDAADEVRRLRTAGYEAVVVDDARAEQ